MLSCTQGVKLRFRSVVVHDKSEAVQYVTLAELIKLFEDQVLFTTTQVSVADTEFVTADQVFEILIQLVVNVQVKKSVFQYKSSTETL